MAEEVNRAWKDQYMLRFPDGMRDRIKQSAEVTGRSMNAEIVQRLKWSFEEAEDEALRIALPSETLNALMTDAALNGVQDEELAAEIIKANYGQAELIRSFSMVNEMAKENEELSVLVSHMKAKEDSDFLLYYGKVVQLRQLAQSILAEGGQVPDHIAAMARDIEKLGQAEIETLANRHDDAVFKKRLAEHSRRLREDIDENEREPILYARPADPGSGGDQREG